MHRIDTHCRDSGEPEEELVVSNLRHFTLKASEPRAAARSRVMKVAQVGDHTWQPRDESGAQPASPAARALRLHPAARHGAALARLRSSQCATERTWRRREGGEGKAALTRSLRPRRARVRPAASRRLLWWTATSRRSWTVRCLWWRRCSTRTACLSSSCPTRSRSSSASQRSSRSRRVGRATPRARHGRPAQPVLDQTRGARCREWLSLGVTHAAQALQR